MERERRTFDDYVRAGDWPQALRSFATKGYGAGRMGHTRKLLLERAADIIENPCLYCALRHSSACKRCPFINGLEDMGQPCQ